MYKVGFITNDTDLISGFRNADHFEGFYIFSSLDDVENTDVLIVSDKNISINVLLNTNVNVKHLFYMVSNENYSDHVRELMNTYGYIYIPPKLTIKQIVEKINSKLLSNIKKINNNVIVFFGADNKVGTTMISQSVAERVATNKNLNVLLLFLNGNRGTDYTGETVFNNCLDNIKIKLYNKILNTSELDEVIVKEGNLHILQGTKTLIDRRHYHPNHVEYLIELVAKKYDVIIIDAGSNIELGMSIGALNAASQKYMIANQKNKTLSHYSYIHEQALYKLTMQDFLLIINMYVDNPYLPLPIHIAEELKMPLIATINYEELGWQAENEHKTLLNYHLSEYEKSIDKIISLIAKKVGFEYNIEEEKNFFQKIKQKLLG